VKPETRKVLDRLEKGDKTYTIQFTGDEENNINGISILLHTPGFSCRKKNIYFGLPKKTIDLLTEAKIDFNIL